MAVMSSGLGLSYDRGPYTSAHGPAHGMQRQKSIGEAVWLPCLPVPAPVCLSSGAVKVSTVHLFVCGQRCLVCGQSVGTFYLCITVCHKFFH